MRGTIRRSRWAAVGAAVAVTLGAGGVVRLVGAADPPSSFVPVTPVRILDTRDPTNVGLAGPFVSPMSQDLQVTGAIATTTGTQTVVPAGSTGVVLNVTAVAPTANGFVSLRPADAPGTPSTSNLNVTAGSIVPNSVTVAVPTVGADAGRIEITFDAYGTPGPTTDLLVDVVGYYVTAPSASGPDARAAYAGGNQNSSLPSGGAVLRSVTIDAPGAGVVVANANVGFNATPVGTLVVCSITTGSAVDGTAELTWTSGSSPDTGGSLSGTRGFAVAGASSITVNFVCAHPLGGTVMVYDPSLTAIWAPAA